jgi:hypothetical protein
MFSDEELLSIVKDAQKIIPDTGEYLWMFSDDELWTFTKFGEVHAIFSKSYLEDLRLCNARLEKLCDPRELQLPAV